MGEGGWSPRRSVKLLQKRYEMNDEETGKWIVLNFFPHSPTYVYGFFDDKEQAHAYAQTNGMTENGNAYSVHMVHNAHYQEDASDYAGMGWVGRDGRA
jgi:hypothetical protein